MLKFTNVKLYFQKLNFLSVRGNISVFGKGPQTLEFFFNGAKLSVNIVNSVKTFRDETRSQYQFHISVLSSLFTHIITCSEMCKTYTAFQILFADGQY